MWRFVTILMLAGHLHADVTIRYQNTVKSPFSVPGVDSPDAIRIKGSMGQVTNGGFTLIMDFNTRQLTILDTWHTRYVTIPAAEYSKRLASLFSGDADASLRAIFDRANSKVESRVTGREEDILGVKAIEREVRLEFAQPAGLTVAMQIWSAKAGEALRVPAIRELSAMNLFEQFLFNPGGMPAAGGIRTLMEEMQKDESVVLRVKTTASLPQAANGETIESMQEAIEISTSPVDPAIFRVPADYTAAPFEEVVLGATKARAQSTELLGPALNNAPAPGVVQAYVPRLVPTHTEEPKPSSAPTLTVVQVLVTVDPRGDVAQAEALTGAENLRQAAVAAVKKFRFHPVVRSGQAVFAYTDTSVVFQGGRRNGNPSAAEMDADMAAMERLSALEQSMPRSAGQVLTDLENDSEGGGETRRFYALPQIAKAALKAGADEKAARAAKDLLDGAEKNRSGDAVFTGHTVQGLLALKRGDVAAAGSELLASGKTSGSPVLNSFGPNVSLAKALIERGERDIVLRYFDECRIFWKQGLQQLDRWSEVVRAGGMPEFGANLVY